MLPLPPLRPRKSNITNQLMLLTLKMSFPLAFSYLAPTHDTIYFSLRIFPILFLNLFAMSSPIPFLRFSHPLAIFITPLPALI